MRTSPPAQVGSSLNEVETPALLVDLDAFEHNLDLMAGTVATAGLRLRPHAKTHKCAAIALQQIARGAVGVCCQKVSEAEALVAGGVPDVLVTNEIVDPAKLERLARLAQRARIGICVDNLDNLPAVAQAAAASGTLLDVLIEVDVGGARCGLAPDRVADFAERVGSYPALRFRGLHAYHGRAQHIRGWDERRRAIEESAAKARDAVARLKQRNIACEIVTGAGTGTYLFETASGIYNELQPGSYIFMDADYARNGSGETAPRFRQSLFVLTQVMSVPRPGFAVVDAGLKALAFDSGPPVVVDANDFEYQTPSDDHGALISPGGHTLRLGTKLRLVPGHCDPTVNLYDWFVGFRADRVESVWPIASGTIR